MLKDRVKTPAVEAQNTGVYGQYTIEVDNREEVQARLGRILSLPMHAFLDKRTQDRIVEAVRSCA